MKVQWNEHKDYQFGDGLFYDKCIDHLDQNGDQAVCGHYTQVVWWNSQQLGCWTQKCFCDSELDCKKRDVYSEGSDACQQNCIFNLSVCHQRHRGNIISKRVYEKGSRCANCPFGFRCCAVPPQTFQKNEQMMKKRDMDGELYKQMNKMCIKQLRIDESSKDKVLVHEQNDYNCQ